MSAKKQQYSKMDPISHVLARPDMYVGSTRARNMEEFVVVDDAYRVEKKTVKYSPAILRIFIEPLSNIIDNVARGKKARKPVTKICVEIDDKTGETSFWNDGLVIPVEMHEEEECYNHTLIFGHLLTSSNYDDDEERYDISGRNGLGVKLTNVFSTKFRVRGFDPKVKKTFAQTWTNNMKKAENPAVRASKLKTGFTSVVYTPDFKQFGIKNYTEDILSVYKKYIVDMAMITKVPVYFNNELIPVQNLVDYANLYLVEPTKEVLHIKTKDCEVVLTPAREYQTISFANGVCTPLGGTHVDAWSEKLFRPLVQKLNKPKKPQISIKDVKQCFRLFVIASVSNPKFDSQQKLKLEDPSVPASVKKTHVATICRWSVMDRLEDMIRAKEFVVLKKIERKKRGHTVVAGLDPANNEGGKNGHLCTLILVEGLSAKTYAVCGIQVGAFGKKGRDWFGIYPLRGKVLNCRNASATMISKNNVIGDVIKAMNLRQNVDYTKEKNYKSLRYGKIMLVTDADVDGIHISGLVLNAMHTLYPSLFERDEPFITAMQTPIVRVYLGKRDKLFYDEREYRKYVAKYRKKHPNKKISQKYYKGLGSSSNEEVLETFGVKLVEFTDDENTATSMNKVFHKNYADARKEWLGNYDPENIKLAWEGEDEEIQRLSVSDFVETEMIKFSLEDCKRSIPHVLDGLKESHRKILYVALLKKFNKVMKVAQFGAQVALTSGYHHGEQNLFDTLIKMAQSFPGSNNIPLFYRGGQFGTRLSGGKDSASPRYIHTKLEALTRLLYHPEDDELLKHLEDDGKTVEPEFYVPILPMILVNGCTAGIGTGWSCSVPSYDPLDLIAAVKVWLKHDGKVIEKTDDTCVSLLPELTPWYREWTGTIEAIDGKYISHGRIIKKGTKKVVEELPIGLWTDTFRDKLEVWKESKQISGYKNYCTPKTIHFEISESKDGFTCNEGNLKLSSYIHTTNMVMFTPEGLRKFNSVDEILDYYCGVRYNYYVKRKANMLNKLEAEVTLLGNKKRFMEEVIAGKIKLFKKVDGKKTARPTDELVSELEERKYDKIFKKTKKTDEDEEEDHGTDHGYSYLLSMQIRSITAEKINKLKNDVASAIERRDELKSTTEKKMWLNDLKAFEKEYKGWLKTMEKEKVLKPRKKK